MGPTRIIPPRRQPLGTGHCHAMRVHANGYAHYTTRRCIASVSEAVDVVSPYSGWPIRLDRYGTPSVLRSIALLTGRWYAYAAQAVRPSVCRGLLGYWMALDCDGLSAARSGAHHCFGSGEIRLPFGTCSKSIAYLASQGSSQSAYTASILRDVVHDAAGLLHVACGIFA